MRDNGGREVISCDVYYYIRWRLKLEGETENICVWAQCLLEVRRRFGGGSGRPSMLILPSEMK